MPKRNYPIIQSLQDRNKRNEGIVAYAKDHLDLTYKQLGEHFNLSPMSIWFIVRQAGGRLKGPHNRGYHRRRKQTPRTEEFVPISVEGTTNLNAAAQ